MQSLKARHVGFSLYFISQWAQGNIFRTVMLSLTSDFKDNELLVRSYVIDRDR